MKRQPLVTCWRHINSLGTEEEIKKEIRKYFVLDENANTENPIGGI
jgi:hypothetical protein